MAVVVDASVLVRLATGGEWADTIEHKVASWRSTGERLHSPALQPYEVASALRGMVFARSLSDAEAAESLARLSLLPIVLHPPPEGKRLLDVARRQGRRAAYDAAYLVLSDDLAAEFWSADRGLVRNSRTLGVDAHFIGDEAGPTRV